MATRDELIALLKEAEAAYHELLIGVSVHMIMHQNGQRVQYTQADRAALGAYISDLKRQLGQTNLGPMKVWF